MFVQHLKRHIHPFADNLRRRPLVEEVRDRTASNRVGTTRRGTPARITVVPERVAVLRVAVVGTAAVAAGLRRLIHPDVNRVSGRPAVGRGEQRSAAVVVDLLGPVRVLGVVLDHLEDLGTEVDPAVPGVAVFEIGSLVGAVLEDDRVLVRTEIVDVYRASCRPAHPGGPEEEHQRVVAARVVVAVERGDDRPRALGSKVVVARLGTVGEGGRVNLLAKPLLDGFHVRPPFERGPDRTQLLLERDRGDVPLSPRDEVSEVAAVEVVQVLDLPRVTPVEEVIQSSLGVVERRRPDRRLPVSDEAFDPLVRFEGLEVVAHR